MRSMPSMPWMPLCLALVWMVLTGCSEQRTITLSTRPVPANVRIDGVDKGPAPVTNVYSFDVDHPSYRVELTRAGYKDQTFDITVKTEPNLIVDMRPLTRKITFMVRPYPAMISVNGKPLAPTPVASAQAELEFTLDANEKWTTYKVVADRPGFQPAERTITWTDPEPTYILTLEPMRKELTITTTPPGATIALDDEEIGVSPLVYKGSDNKGVGFFIDPATKQWSEYRLRVSKPGYDAIESKVGWDEGKTEYAIDLIPRSKTVRIVSTPPDAVVTIDGKELSRGPGGISSAMLIFAPINEKGDLKRYTATVSKKAADSEWETRTLEIGWDQGKAEYAIALKEIKTLPVPLLVAEPKRGEEGWTMVRRSVATTAMKDVGETNAREQPKRLTNLPKGSMIDSLAISPDGAHLVFSVIQSRGENDLHSQLMMIRTDGSGGLESFSDGKSLDLHPSFSPDGRNVIFASNRGGKRMSIWMMSAAGAPGITQLTNDDNNDLWPSMDANRHLFYQAFVDTRADPRLFMTELGKTTRTDLTQAGGTQPRVSPDAKADSGTLLFTNVNEKSGKRDLFSMKTDGGIPENITNTPDSDEFDAAWNHEGTKLAFASDRGVDEEKRNNFDIWILDLANPAQPVQITSNGSWDDCPVWDPSGNSIYFRSNRGGEWAIWKIVVK